MLDVYAKERTTLEMNDLHAIACNFVRQDVVLLSPIRFG